MAALPLNVEHFDSLPGTAILRRVDVRVLTSLSNSTLDRLIADGSFPTPIKLGQRAIGWRAEDIRNYLSRLV